MDALTWAALAAGVAAGMATGLVPGLHVNTLAAAGAALLPVLGPHGALFLAAVGTVHTIVNIVPATFLGVPDEDDALTMLPAHRLLQEGRAMDAVQVSARASLAALVAVVAAAPAYAWLLAGPPGLLGRLDAWVPVVLLVTAGLLLLGERHRGLAGVAWAAVVFAASGGLGYLSADLPLRTLGWIPPTPLLPLLAGLFGAPALLVALRRRGPVALQRRPGDVRPTARPVAGGILAAAFTAVVPGITAAVATTLVPRRRDDPIGVIAAMSAVNTAHAVLALVVLSISGRLRTGLAAAVSDGLPDTAWSMPPPPGLADLAFIVLVAGAVGTLATLALGRLAATHVERLPGRRLAAAALLVVVALTAVSCGWVGLLLLAAATAVGLVPLAVGVRRVHLVGCLIVPVLVWTL